MEVEDLDRIRPDLPKAADDNGRSLYRDVQPELLLHLAWYAEHGKFWSSPENLRWVASTLDLLAAFAAAGGRRSVLAGTCAEYDWGATAGPCEELSTPLRPATLYGAAKHGLHVVASAYAAQAGFELAWARGLARVASRAGMTDRPVHRANDSVLEVCSPDALAA